MATVKGEGGLFPETVHFIVVVLPLALFTAYFLHVNIAKCRNIHLTQIPARIG